MTHFFPNYSITHGPGIHANFRFSNSLSALDRYGLKLANAGHTWTLKERKMFEKRVRELKAKKRNGT